MRKIVARCGVKVNMIYFIVPCFLIRQTFVFNLIRSLHRNLLGFLIKIARIFCLQLNILKKAVKISVGDFLLFEVTRVFQIYYQLRLFTVTMHFQFL